MTQRIKAIRLHPKIPIYQNLGDGRDTYISFYNGGFGKYKLTDTYLKEKTDLENDEFIILAGNDYMKYLIEHILNTYNPVKGLGIGQQMKFFKEFECD